MLNLTFISSDPIIYAVAILSTIWLILYRKGPQRVAPLPPGPKPLPILGNAHQVPTEDIQKVYREWRTLYGDMVHFTVGKQHILLLNTPRHVFGLLEKQGKIFSNRPPSVMIKMVGLDDTWVLSPYGDTLRYFRKLGRHVMGAQATVKYESVEEDEARSFVKALLDSPNELMAHVNRSMSNILLRILYGYSPSPELDDLSEAGEKISYEAGALVVASSRLLDLFPPLRHLPMFRHRAESIRKVYQHVINTPFNMVKTGLDKASALGNHSPSNSLCATLLLEGLTGQPGSAGSEHSIKMFLGSIYPPGQESTSATLYMFFLMMGNNPGVQAKARAEILSITGGHRLPQLSDRTSFVYVMAVFKELLRYHSVAPLGLPHQSDEEYVYEGYRIPKNTIVFGNIWEILHDPETYPDPFEFKPERFLNMEANTPDGYPTDPREYVFGFGRRACPASHLAESTLLISIATVLAAYDIGPCFKPDGSKIENFQYTPTLVAHPLPFKCSIKAIARELL